MSSLFVDSRHDQWWIAALFLDGLRRCFFRKYEVQACKTSSSHQSSKPQCPKWVSGWRTSVRLGTETRIREPSSNLACFGLEKVRFQNGGCAVQQRADKQLESNDLVWTLLERQLLFGVFEATSLTLLFWFLGRIWFWVGLERGNCTEFHGMSVLLCWFICR